MLISALGVAAVAASKWMIASKILIATGTCLMAVSPDIEKLKNK